MWFRTLSILAVVCLVPADALSAHDDYVTKIVGGQNVTIEEFPWQVSLLNRAGSHFCGGTILDRYTILTAAHCVVPGDRMFVRAGSTLHRTGGDVRPVSRIVQHEFYDNEELDNDIALVILQYPLIFNERIQPAHLPEFDYDLANNVTVLVSGWGTRQIANETNPEHLQAIAVQTVNQQECYEAYQVVNSTVTDNMCCAGIYPGGGKDSCQGDSGGPVVEIYRDRPIVHGIVSGEGCGLATHPGVYTRVSRFLQWIRNNQ